MRIRRTRPLRDEVLLLFLPLVILSVVLVGLTAYYLQEVQVRNNAQTLIQNTVRQTAILINDKLSTAFLQLDTISNDTIMQNLLVNTYPKDQQTEMYNDIINLNSLLQNTCQNNYPMMDSILFCNAEGLQITAFPQDVPVRINFDVTQWLRQYAKSDNEYLWQNSHEDSVFVTSTKRQVITLFRNISYGGQEPQGVLLFNLRMQYYSDLLDDVKISRHGYVMMISPDNAIKSSGDSARYDMTEKDTDRLRHQAAKSGSMTMTSTRGQKLLVVYNQMSINHWIIAAVVPTKDLLTEARTYKLTLGILALVLIAVSTVVSMRLARVIATPIQYLSGQVDKFERGERTIDFEVRETNEIGVLAKGLSNLLSTVNHLIEKVKQEQEQKAQVELLALQSQIKPHFLYNTLGSLRNLIEMGEYSKADRMCESLIWFYRIITSRGKERIPIREEVEHVRSYLIIQKMRYGEQLGYSIQMDRDILDVPILKLTLQPLVENSIYHGIKNKDGPGMVVVTGHRAGSDCVLEVYDDGVGMSEKDLGCLTESINRSGIDEAPRTFGLRNVNQRLKLNYGAQYGITVESVAHVYTRVQVKIPLLLAKKAGGDGDHVQAPDRG